LLERGAQHVHHPEQRPGRLAVGIGQRRQRVEGAEQVRGSVDQHESWHDHDSTRATPNASRRQVHDERVVTRPARQITPHLLSPTPTTNSQQPHPHNPPSPPKESQPCPPAPSPSPPPCCSRWPPAPPPVRQRSKSRRARSRTCAPKPTAT